MNASEQILQSVEHAWAEAKKSENKVDKNAAEMIEFKAVQPLTLSVLQRESILRL